jgi:hypothetical protein
MSASNQRHSPIAWRRWAIVLFSAWVFATTGCGPREQIAKYSAPKDPATQNNASDAAEPGEPEARILAAIVAVDKPEANNWYFFKFAAPPKSVAPPKAVDRHQAAFVEFIQSLKFPPGGKPTWSLPKGWREIEKPMRLATLTMKSSETPLELAVTQFGGPLLDNINRWHDQVGAPTIKAEEIEKKCKILTVDGKKVYIVDVSGPGGKGGMMPPFAK